MDHERETGHTSNFFNEAWAAFVEGLMIRSVYGADADHQPFLGFDPEAGHRRRQPCGVRRRVRGQQNFVANYDERKNSLSQGCVDSVLGQSSVRVNGDSAFNRGMRLFIDGMGKGPSGSEELMASFIKRRRGMTSTSFVMPWLRSKYIPDIDARVDGARLIVTQSQPDELFDLPKFEVELTTAFGVIRRTIHLAHRADTLSLQDIGAVNGGARRPGS